MLLRLQQVSGACGAVLGEPEPFSCVTALLLPLEQPKESGTCSCLGHDPALGGDLFCFSVPQFLHLCEEKPARAGVRPLKPGSGRFPASPSFPGCRRATSSTAAFPRRDKSAGRACRARSQPGTRSLPWVAPLLPLQTFRPVPHDVAGAVRARGGSAPLLEGCAMPGERHRGLRSHRSGDGAGEGCGWTGRTGTGANEGREERGHTDRHRRGRAGRGAQRSPRQGGMEETSTRARCGAALP